MSTAVDRILDVLEAEPDGICDDCLSDIAIVKPRQQANQICNRLARTGVLSRDKAACSRCGESKLVNHLAVLRINERAQQPRSQSSLPPSVVKPELKPKAQVERLDSMRRQMVEILDSVEGARAKGQGFSERVSKLRDASTLPGNIACMMHTLNSLRNLCVYEGHVLGAEELRVVESAWVVIEDWRKSQSQERSTAH